MYVIEIVGEDSYVGHGHAAGIVGLCDTSFKLLKKLADHGYTVTFSNDNTPTGLPTPSDAQRERFVAITERVSK